MLKCVKISDERQVKKQNKTKQNKTKKKEKKEKQA